MIKFFFIFAFCLISCSPKTNNKDLKDFKNIQNKTVSIIGFSDEKGFNESLNFYEESIFYVNANKNLIKEIYKDSVVISIKNIDKPKLFNIIAFGENTFYTTNIFLTPGDRLKYFLKEGKLKFTGANKEHFNFYSELDPEIDDWSQLYLNKYNPDFKKYKKQCDSLYSKRLIFFNNYIKKHPTVSDEFKKAIKDDLRFEYLVNIIRPRSEIQGKWNVNTSEDLITIYERKDKKEDVFFDLNAYLNNLSIKDINNPEYLNNMYFKTSIVPLIRQYFVKSNKQAFSIESFNEELLFLKENFNQSIVDYATGRLIVDYFNQGFGKDKKTIVFFRKAIQDYKESIKDSSAIVAMNDIELELNSINKTLPKNIHEKVLNLSKDTVDLSLSLQEKKIKIIDFWASWCQPCIKEIIISKAKRREIASKYNVEFIYISLDKETQKWIDKSVDLFEFLPNKHQYKLLDYKKSNLIKLLNLKSSYGISIPRYVILDKNNEVINNNAPKPSDAKFEEIIKSILYKN